MATFSPSLSEVVEYAPADAIIFYTGRSGGYLEVLDT